ncbi:MAG TPA: hypothetical protein VFY64_08440 [Nitrososphaeraceae archaeon]|nr:hypothetical protein [Nitrososphaeraceae archaeon]
MVIEEVRFDFEEFRRYADDFIYNLLKLMIISKMNSTFKDISSRQYFVNLIQQIDCCEAYIVKYGQPILYAKYRGMEFSDQKITSQFVRVNDHTIDVTMESAFEEFIKSFDILAFTTASRVNWGINVRKDSYIDPFFELLDSFVHAVHRLTLLDKNNADSLMGKRFGIKNIHITKQLTHLEFLVDGQVNILGLYPSKKKGKVETLFGNSSIASAIVSLMKQ